MIGLKNYKATVEACGIYLSLCLGKDIAPIDAHGSETSWKYISAPGFGVAEIKRYQLESGGAPCL